MVNIQSRELSYEAIHSTDDRLLTLTGSLNRSYTYTADGALLTMTDNTGTTTYEYDVIGNLKKVILPSTDVIEYKVDGLNRRVKKLINGATSEYYIWYDSLRLAAILDSAKSVKTVYIYGPESNSPNYLIQNGIEYRIIQDPTLGSIRYIINQTNLEITQEIEYDEFGNMMKNTNPNFQPLTFAGGLYDSDTKLIRFGARDYDPTIGRWTSKDPIGFNGGDTNLYAYVGGDPMSYIDPTGTTVVCTRAYFTDSFICMNNNGDPSKSPFSLQTIPNADCFIFCSYDDPSSIPTGVSPNTIFPNPGQIIIPRPISNVTFPSFPSLPAGGSQNSGSNKNDSNCEGGKK